MAKTKGVKDFKSPSHATPPFKRWMRSGLDQEFCNYRYGVGNGRAIPAKQLRAAIRQKYVESIYTTFEYHGKKINGIRHKLTPNGRRWAESETLVFKEL